MRLNYVLFVLVFSVLVIVFCGCSKDEPGMDTTSLTTFTDPRDGQIYEITTIGDQTWFAENLKYNTNDLTTSVCYDNDEINCFLYGRLYEGHTALEVCPEGWHLPSIEEWEELVDYLGGEQAAFALLEPFGKVQGELINFNILAGGNYFNGSYTNLGTEGLYWTSTEPAGKPDSYLHVRYKPGQSISLNGGGSAVVRKSCRCIKD